MSKRPTLGLIINPIAGMGGSVGLKGTDGTDILRQAQDMGAVARATERTREFLHELRGLKKKIEISTLSGIMGGDIASEMGFDVNFLEDSSFPDQTKLFETKAEYTIKAAKLMKENGVALILFVGGDGTARNIFEAVGSDVACLGIPGGVKIHSSVFATTPVSAAQLTLQYLWGEAPLRESEVMDIDEVAFRKNEVIAKLYGYLKTPYSPTFIQPSKMATPRSEDEYENQMGIARWVVEEMDHEAEKLQELINSNTYSKNSSENSAVGPSKSSQDSNGWYYLVGPGTTPRAIAIALKQEKTLLGVDLMYNKRIIQRDMNEDAILQAIEGKKVKLFVTPIGGQGFIFGRGNLQLSPKVLRKVGLENIMIIATKYKLSTVPNGKLRIDSRDPEFDNEFIGFYRVLVSYGEYRIVDVIR